MAGAIRPRMTAIRRDGMSKSRLGALRRSGTVPGSVYGRAAAPVSLQVAARAVGAYLGAHGSGALMDLDMDGQLTPVMLREVDRDAITGAVIHVSFQRIVLSDQIHASIPLRFEGVEELIRKGLVLQTQLDTVELHGQADHLPEALTLDVRDCAAGDILHISAITLPEGVALARDGSTAAAIVTSPRTTEPEAELAAATEPAAAEPPDAP